MPVKCHRKMGFIYLAEDTLLCEAPATQEVLNKWNIKLQRLNSQPLPELLIQKFTNSVSSRLWWHIWMPTNIVSIITAWDAVLGPTPLPPVSTLFSSKYYPLPSGLFHWCTRAHPLSPPSTARLHPILSLAAPVWILVDITNTQEDYSGKHIQKGSVWVPPPEVPNATSSHTYLLPDTGERLPGISIFQKQPCIFKNPILPFVGQRFFPRKPARIKAYTPPPQKKKSKLDKT